ncbi:MAG: ferritin-like domain-containing protein [Caulobacteraceae bacterium]
MREQARQHIEKGPVTQSYGGDTQQAIDILQSVLATEIVCVLRYTQHAIVATGLASESVKAEFLEHAGDEQGHAMQVAERINQLGGAPDFNPADPDCPLSRRVPDQRRSGGDDPRKSDRRADRCRALPRAGALLRR